MKNTILEVKVSTTELDIYNKLLDIIVTITKDKRIDEDVRSEYRKKIDELVEDVRER